jgi:HJR/Mrr/RecB family endonuclease
LNGAITARQAVFSEFSNDLSPTDFEIFCAEQLKRSGWDARVTLQSRDQGVDVIGEKAGVRIVFAM